jgi:hypothetical protein
MGNSFLKKSMVYFNYYYFIIIHNLLDVFEALEKEETNISIEDIKRVAALLAAESKTKKP